MRLAGFSIAAAFPELAFIKAGSLDDASWLEPAVEVWTSSAQPWSPHFEHARADGARTAVATLLLIARSSSRQLSATDAAQASIGIRSSKAKVGASHMSEENLAVVREIYRAFAEHRFPADCLAEEFAWETHGGLDPGPYRGHEGVRAYFRDWVGGWHDVQSKVEQLIDRGDEVIALIHGSYRLSPEGQPIEDRYAHVWTLHEGKAVHARATGRSPEELGFRIPED